MSLKKIVSDIEKCTLCDLSAGHNPTVQLSSESRILIAGQAPGLKVHETSIPFNDASGDRLRDWMGLTKEDFYNPEKVAILPMAFCYPGKGKSGDLPPPKLCADTWRTKALDHMDRLQLTLVIGQYAQAWHLPDNKMNVTKTVAAWQTFDQSIMVLPHPSPRNNIWLKKNEWYETEVLPELKRRVRDALIG